VLSAGSLYNNGNVPVPILVWVAIPVCTLWEPYSYTVTASPPAGVLICVPLNGCMNGTGVTNVWSAATGLLLPTFVKFCSTEVVVPSNVDNVALTLPSLLRLLKSRVFTLKIWVSTRPAIALLLSPLEYETCWPTERATAHPGGVLPVDSWLVCTVKPPA